MSTIKVDKITGRTGSASTAPITLSGDTVTLGSNVVSETATTSTLDPTTSSNPSAVGHLWINSTSGNAYICIDATTNNNTWRNMGDGSAWPTVYADYLIVAGGGSSYHDSYIGSGGGAGGYRTSYGDVAVSGVNLIPTAIYTCTVGAGGTGTASASSSGANSSLIGTGISISSTGGGRGAANGNSALSGGSGGGAYASNAGSKGAGNAGNYVPVEGYGGGIGHDGLSAHTNTGGGGGAKEKGYDSAQVAGNSGDLWSGNGGDGLPNAITGSSVTYAGGGGGGSDHASSTNVNGTPAYATGGAGGGGNGFSGTAGTTSTSGADGKGGGAGGANDSSGQVFPDGGNGVVILRILTSDYTGTVTGSPTVTTDGDYKVIKFLATGTYTA